LVEYLYIIEIGIPNKQLKILPIIKYPPHLVVIFRWNYGCKRDYILGNIRAEKPIVGRRALKLVYES